MEHAQYALQAELEDAHWWFVGRRRIIATLVDQLLPPTCRGLIVDIGCGAGANLAQFAARHECIGIDVSEEAIAHARRRFPKLTFRHAGKPQDYADVLKRANVLLLNDVLEHVAADREFLASVICLAPPGTTVLITVPADMALWGTHDVSHGHFRRYTHTDIVELWQELPVETMLVSYFNARLYPVVRLCRMLGRLRNHTWGSANTDLRIAPWPINGFLANLFAGEAHRLQRVLRGASSAQYRHGVSLIAVLKVLPNSSTVRSAESLHRPRSEP